MTALARITLIEHAAALIDGQALVQQTRSVATPETDQVAPWHDLKLTAQQLYNLADEMRAEAGLATPWAEKVAA